MQLEYAYQERKNERRRFVLTDTGVEMESTKKGRQSFAFQEIKFIRLLSPLKGVFVTLIQNKNGEKIALGNRSFVSLGKFDLQNEDYLNFIKALHEKTASYSGIEYRIGSSALYWFFIISLPILGLLLLAMLYLKITRPSRIRIPYSIFAMFFAFPLIINYLKQGKSKHYFPENLPEKFIPSSINSD